MEVDVLRLDVAVDHALFVRRAERLDELHHDVDRVVERDALATQPRCERLSFEPVHHQIAAPVGQLAEREHIDDVRV